MGTAHILASVCVSALVCFTPSVSAVSIWSEDFTSQDGKGADGVGTDMSGITKWSLDVSSCALADTDDFCKVLSAAFVTRDSKGEMIWTSESVDISAHGNVALSISLSEAGDLYGTEYLRCYYRLDGGAETQFDANGDMTGNFDAVTASQSGLSGSTLQVIVKANSSDGTHILTFDTVTVTGDLLAAEPTTDAVNLVFSSITNTQASLTWSNGDGAGRIVVARESAAVSQVPTDGTSYGANAAFGSGGAIALNEYVVYAGSDTTVTVTDLSPDTVYHFAIFEYNGTGGGANYYTSGSPLIGSTTTLMFPPVITEGASVNVTMSENGAPLAFSLTLNATDPDSVKGDTVTWSIVRTAQHGNAQVSGTAWSTSPQYVPTPYYSGTDTFSVRVTDSYGNSTSTRVIVKILPVNVPGKTVFIFE